MLVNKLRFEDNIETITIKHEPEAVSSRNLKNPCLQLRVGSYEGSFKNSFIRRISKLSCLRSKHLHYDISPFKSLIITDQKSLKISPLS